MVTATLIMTSVLLDAGTVLVLPRITQRSMIVKHSQ